MSVEKETVRRVARLARLALSDERCDAMVKELNGILGWVEQLKEVNIDGVEPLTSVVQQRLKMRDDVDMHDSNATTILVNAPESEENYFLVPKVVE